MSFSSLRSAGQILTLAGMTAALAACGGNGTNAPAYPPVNTFTTATTYKGPTLVTWANWPPAATANPSVSSFDISFVDPSVGQYYVADRNNAGVSVVNTATDQYVRTAGAGLFTGFKPNGPSGPPANAGPNGLVPVGNGIVFAGDGDSTMKVVNVNTGALLATIPTVNPYTGAPLPLTCGGTGTPTTGTANMRVDEMDYDPTDNVVVAINDAACPPFATFFSGSAPYSILGSVAFTTANNGAEQPKWDPAQKLFIEAIPSTIANPNGELDYLDPVHYTITKVVGLSSNCQPAGNSIGLNETEVLGCGQGEILTVNAATGATTNVISGLGGCDEDWYNPTVNRFYVACSSNKPSPVLVITDGSGNLLTTLPTGPGQHSVAVDPTDDNVFVPSQKAGLQVFTH